MKNWVDNLPMAPRECLHVAVLISLNSQYVGPLKEGKSVGRYLSYVSRKQSEGSTFYPHHGTKRMPSRGGADFAKFSIY